LNKTYEDATKEFMRTVNQYMKKVLDATGTGAGAGAGTHNDPLAIQLDSEGFPIVPSPASWGKTTKEQFEKMYRTFMSHHYSTYVTYMPVLILILF
jgi:hypothetical protein